jgi:hypothetical protein
VLIEVVQLFNNIEDDSMYSLFGIEDKQLGIKIERDTISSTKLKECSMELV